MGPLPSVSPEIFIGGRSTRALERTLRFGAGYLPYLVDAKQARGRFERLAEMNAGGRDLRAFTFGVATFLVAGISVDDGAQRARNAPGFAGIDEDRLRRFYVLGSVEDC